MNGVGEIVTEGELQAIERKFKVFRIRIGITTTSLFLGETSQSQPQHPFL